ncbi:MAG: hypothetical protein PVG41_16635 [Desulfobacteraceae bacterium]|jgi:hypothetical protein
MNKLIDGYASRTEGRYKHEMNLYLGPCFDLTLSASEAIKIFDDRRKMRSGQSQAAPDATEPETSTQHQPRGKN